MTVGPPVNACPAHPCAAYRQPGGAPTCSADGVCEVDASVGDTLLVIDLAVDSIFAPGRTYVTTLDRAAAETGACALPDCSGTECKLDPWVLDANSYLLYPSAAKDIGQDLGSLAFTALPVQATYRRLIPTAGGATADAVDLGLPIDPVEALNVTTGFYHGPEGGPAIQFQAYMQPGCYVRTLQPYPPFSEVYAPEIEPWSQATGMNALPDFDGTKEEIDLPKGSTTPFPTFEIARAEGLDGWTAYLRSIDTKRVYSNVAPLRGSLASNVILVTNHLTPTIKDALDGLELVIAPPTGTPLPAEVLAPIGTPPSRVLPAPEPYPSLPLPVTVSGRVAAAGGVPVPATVIFTATDIFDRTGTPFPPNFEFVTQASTTVDPRTGAARYSVVLPRGNYTIAVRPTDGSSAISLSTGVVDGSTGATSTLDLAVGRLVSVSGHAKVADGRWLSEAIVEAVPTACAANPGTAGSAPDASSAQSIAISMASDACMPRAQQTLTSTDGYFALALDPGSYLLRVRPVEGSHLPWTMQALTIPPSSESIPFDPVVPAPVRIRMDLRDTDNKLGNGIANAVVRVFTDPSAGGAPVELGRAITDSNGNYEIDLAPPAQ
ncbi:MAG TPA: hypothetical protein VII82_03410 [Polyangiaceae bacterium]